PTPRRAALPPAPREARRDLLIFGWPGRRRGGGSGRPLRIGRRRADHVLEFANRLVGGRRLGARRAVRGPRGGHGALEADALDPRRDRALEAVERERSEEAENRRENEREREPPIRLGRLAGLDLRCIQPVAPAEHAARHLRRVEEQAVPRALDEARRLGWARVGHCAGEYDRCREVWSMVARRRPVHEITGSSLKDPVLQEHRLLEAWERIRSFVEHPSVQL